MLHHVDMLYQTTQVCASQLPPPQRFEGVMPAYNFAQPGQNSVMAKQSQALVPAQEWTPWVLSMVLNMKLSKGTMKHTVQLI